MNTISDKDTIKTVMSDLKAGKYVIPRFQREFVWPAKKIVYLAESLDRNFPIGVITSWRTNRDTFGGRNGVIEALSNNGTKNDIKLIIDGQQRITSIAILYFANEIALLIKNNPNLFSKKISKTINDAIKGVILYKERFYERSKFLEMCEDMGMSRMEANEQAALHAIYNDDVNEKLRARIDKYPIFMHVIENADLGSIIDVFRAMNRKTIALTHVELMNGSMFNSSDDKFDLLNFINTSNVRWSHFGKIKNELFVILIKIYSDLSIQRRYEVSYKTPTLVEWANVNERVNSFLERKAQFQDAVSDTISVFERKLNIYTIAGIPKDVYFLVVFSVVCKIGVRDSKFETILNESIWHVSKRLAKGDYASSPNAKAMEDINKYVMALIDGQTPTKTFDIDDESIKQKLKSEFKNVSYGSKTFWLYKLSISILAGNGPRKFFEDGAVAVTPTGTSAKLVDVHHLIPTKSQMSQKFSLLPARLNRLGNLAIVDPDENRKRISAKDIDDYIDAASFTHSSDEDFKNVLNSHYMSVRDTKELINIYQNESGSTKFHRVLDEFWQNREAKIFKSLKRKFFGYLD